MVRYYLAALAAAAMMHGCAFTNPEQPHIDTLATAAVLSEDRPDGAVMNKLFEYNSAGNYTAAIQLLEEKTEKEPNHVFLITELGISYFDRAEQAIMLQTGNSLVRSDLENAEHYLQKARQMNPDDKRIDPYLERVSLEKALLE